MKKLLLVLMLFCVSESLSQVAGAKDSTIKVQKFTPARATNRNIVLDGNLKPDSLGVGMSTLPPGVFADSLRNVPNIISDSANVLRGLLADSTSVLRSSVTSEIADTASSLRSSVTSEVADTSSVLRSRITSEMSDTSTAIRSSVTSEIADTAYSIRAAIGSGSGEVSFGISYFGADTLRRAVYIAGVTSNSSFNATPFPTHPGSLFNSDDLITVSCVSDSVIFLRSNGTTHGLRFNYVGKK